MKIEQLYTGCLAEAAYYIESEGEAIIIDPLRDIQTYVQKIERNNVTLKYIFETHFHADFVSGHLDLAEATGATIVYGPKAETTFNSHIAYDGEKISIGKITLQVLHTPGHTQESSCYLLYDEDGNKHALFTGDTLFIGDVGRPDLAIKSDLTKEDLAGMLYDSLEEKIKPLPDAITIYPAHGAGSACGKNLSKETFDTLGSQKQKNYALKAADKETFIKQVLDDLQPAPSYFNMNALLNKEGPGSVSELIKQGSIAFDVQSFENLQRQTYAVLLDTRDAKEFKKGFIPGSINIGLNGQLAPWAGTLLTNSDKPILIITDPGKEEETIIRLARVGVDQVIGYLKDGYNSWQKANKPEENIETISAAELVEKLDENINILDVRKADEYEKGHLNAAQHLPLDYINDWITTLDKNKTYYVHCAGGYRSVITESILKSRNISNVIDVSGGYGAIKAAMEPTKKRWLNAFFSFMKVK
ncbi:MBL fold metallo-hydrolase [Cytophaga hutchinsonii]|uniref:Metallo-beta-lactamase superfamily protein n=1 Tax=Cytophaga hutchinsonii (strain ATCC 33406 / DSM 1761 / CIP 103989 / NBRC 15051 / NCIMB 9469 / D465) TaxID=269798 RepID=A0A6N4SQL0_CYTH3|nr:MBL fold metallo-hydrolase [Cytophaga hutchinsonii]ABG58626.1 metallo-beta-lactamase superfamily protein [Cytophaga hutchinsonii ATCC 33406]SFX58354.1 Glyoxylase, beta-lactamase superfamily II [Cytophaga hutchinsonii ATCC 33406]